MLYHAVTCTSDACEEGAEPADLIAALSGRPGACPIGDPTVTAPIDTRTLASYANYRGFLAGVEWGAEHGHGELDDAERAWARP